MSFLKGFLKGAACLGGFNPLCWTGGCAASRSGLTLRFSRSHERNGVRVTEYIAMGKNLLAHAKYFMKRWPNTYTHFNYTMTASGVCKPHTNLRAVAKKTVRRACHLPKVTITKVSKNAYKCRGGQYDMLIQGVCSFHQINYK